METFFMSVGYSTVRPIIADQFITFVVIATADGIQTAKNLAAQMVGCRAEMVTSVTVEHVEI